MSVPNRIAEQNRSASLPELEPGITLLDVDAGLSRVIHALAVDSVGLSGGDALWIDPGTHAQTAPLVDLAPTDRILDRVRIARGFTPFQHVELLRSLPGLLTDRTELVVVPQLDRYYRDETLFAREGRDMLVAGIATLARVARERDIAVLVTRLKADDFSEPIETAAQQELQCQSTPFGPRFQTDTDETVVYPVDGGRWVQTTLAFWAEVLAARQPRYQQGEPTAIPQEVSADGAN